MIHELYLVIVTSLLVQKLTSEKFKKEVKICIKVS